MPKGDYTIKLLSGVTDGSLCPPLTSDLGFSFNGSFTIHVSVEPADGKLPYIVAFRPWPAGASDEIDPGLWVLAGGNLVETPPVPPHARIRVEFSEEMRTPLPVKVTPTILGFGAGTGTVRIQVPDGVDLKSDVERIVFQDSVDGAAQRTATVLSSQTPVGMELDEDYRFEFHGRPPLGSYQSYVRDRSGEGLAMRFFQQPRTVPTTDTRSFKTAPVRIESPAIGSFVNATAVASGPVTLGVLGTIADRVTVVALSLRTLEGALVRDLGPANRTVLNSVNPRGTLIDAFDGQAVVAPSDADGTYLLVAEAFAGGTSLGVDQVELTKDTIAPALVAGGEVTILATDTQVPEFCVDASDDTVSAELLIGASSIETVTTYSDNHPIFGGFRTFRRFCFAPFAVPPSFAAGQNVWTFKLTDSAGNTSVTNRTLAIRPVLLSVSPQDAEPGDTVFLTGFGLGGLSQSDFGVFDGTAVSLGTTIERDHSGMALILPGPPVPVPLGTQSSRALRVPKFVGSSLFAIEVRGTRSNEVPWAVCEPLVGPFVDEAVPNVSGVGALGGITATGLSTNRNGSYAPAGSPIVVFRNANHRLIARVWDGASNGWRADTVFNPNGGGLPGFPSDPGDLYGDAATARMPGGEAAVLFRFIRASDSKIVVRFARRVSCIAGSIGCYAPIWSSVDVAESPLGFTPFGIALTFLEDGRAATIFGTPSGLVAAFETAAGSGVFSAPISIDTRAGTGATLSAVANHADSVWVAYTTEIAAVPLDEIDERNLAISVARVSPSGSSPSLPSPGAGFWPSIDLGPDGTIAVAFQPGSVTLVPSPKDDCTLSLSVKSTSPRFARLEGTTWTSEPIGSRPDLTLFKKDFRSRSCGGPPFLTRDLNRDLPPSQLRIGRASGTAHFVYVRQKGDLILATRTSAWTRGIAALGDTFGGTLALSLDGADHARVAYGDIALGQLRTIRDDDARAVDPAVDRPGCHGTAFDRKTFTPAVSHFTASHDSFPFSKEWLENLPDLSQTGDPAIQAQLRDMYVTALAGKGTISLPPPLAPITRDADYLATSTAAGGEFCKPGKPCSTVSFAIEMDYPRGSGQTELAFLGGSATLSLVNSTNEAVVGVVMRARVRGNAETLEFQIFPPPPQPPALPQSPFKCVAPDGSIDPNTNACGLDTGMLQTEATLTDVRLPTMLGHLFALPPSFDLDTSDFRFSSLNVRLHGLSIATTPVTAGAGRLGVGIGMKSFDVRGTLSGSLGCTGVASASSAGDELVLDGSIGTVALSPTTPTIGEIAVFDPQPELRLPGLLRKIEGSSGCQAEQFLEDALRSLDRALGLKGWLSQVAGGASLGPSDLGSKLQNAGLATALTPIVLTPALRDSFAQQSAEHAWAANVQPDGSVLTETPR